MAARGMDAIILLRAGIDGETHRSGGLPACLSFQPPQNRLILLIRIEIMLPVF